VNAAEHKSLSRRNKKSKDVESNNRWWFHCKGF
jgi:hypothetical protein